MIFDSLPLSFIEQPLSTLLWTSGFAEFLDAFAFFSMFCALIFLLRREKRLSSYRSLWALAFFLLASSLIHLVDYLGSTAGTLIEGSASGLVMTIISFLGVFAPWVFVPKYIESRRLQERQDELLNEKVKDSVAELKSMIAQHREAEDRFQLAIETAPQGLLLVDENGIIVVANKEAERLFAYSRDELLGMSVEALLPESFRASHVAMRGTYHANPASRTMGSGRELLAVRKDGKEFPAEIGLNHIVAGNKKYVMSTIVDITFRKKAERELKERAEELERINTDLDQFAYVASHDLKAPLRAIENLTKWILDDIGENVPGETKENIALLRGRIRRMELLLESLLDYYRVGKTQYSTKQVHSGELVREVIEVMHLPQGFRVEVSDDMPTIHTPRPPLELVFRNIIGNSIKHHHRSEGEIRIYAEEAGDFVRFCICDDGPGIPSEFHEKIFEMFQTLRPRDEVEGSGMGLTLVKKTIQTCGGRLELCSSPGRGTKFCVEWPKKQEPEIKAA